jgi:DeoR/GlpR family transcriptional regulator of sugar metabolism
VNKDRRKQIQKLLQERQEVSIREISDFFNVSISTARRDLDALVDYGKVERLHGGARLTNQAPPELPSLQRRMEQAKEKQAIAAVTVDMIGDNETVFLGSGTTVLEVAHRLPSRINLTVVTNSLLVANVLADRRDINLIVVGGVFRQSEGSFYGHLTESMLSEIHATKVIFGIRAISLEKGLTNDFVPEISTDRKILRMANDVIIVADHTKFNRVSTALVIPSSEIHTIVTDYQTPQHVINELLEIGIDVIVAPRLETSGSEQV